jgi:alpha-ribazole phosphatase
MPLINLMRHGETDRPGLLLGRTDSALSADGWKQFERQTSGRNWSVVVSSPLRRAREPAENLARERHLDLSIDPDWSELDFGEWDGRPISELNADPTIAEGIAALYRNSEAPGPPDGESWQALQARIARALGRLLEKDRAENALVVTHGGPIRAALSLACAIPFNSLWALRINHGARVTLRIEAGEEGSFWGEIVEIVQA